MIKIDGITYNASWLQGLEQSADILNGDGSGRLQGTGEMYLEYVGTFFNHKGTLHRDADCDDNEWARLFEVLANPKNDHEVVLPFGVNQTLTQKIYISQVVRKLKLIEPTNKWERVYDVSFIAKKVSWLPGGNIKGLSQ